MDMLERVARLSLDFECKPHASVTGYGTVWNWDDAMPDVKSRHTEQARTLLRTIREPSHAMCVVGDPSKFAPGDSEAIWEAMIDAALAE